MDIFKEKKKKQDISVKVQVEGVESQGFIGDLGARSYENPCLQDLCGGQGAQTKNDIAEQEFLREEISLIVQNEGRPSRGQGGRQRNKSVAESFAMNPLEFKKDNDTSKVTAMKLN